MSCTYPPAIKFQVKKKEKIKDKDVTHLEGSSMMPYVRHFDGYAALECQKLGFNLILY
jgi:hypothetical protein